MIGEFLQSTDCRKWKDKRNLKYHVSLTIFTSGIRNVICLRMIRRQGLKYQLQDKQKTGVAQAILMMLPRESKPK